MRYVHVAIATLIISAAAVLPPSRPAMALPLTQSPTWSALAAGSEPRGEMLSVRNSGPPIFLPPGHGGGHDIGPREGPHERSYSGPRNLPSDNFSGRSSGRDRDIYRPSSGHQDRPSYERHNGPSDDFILPNRRPSELYTRPYHRPSDHYTQPYHRPDQGKNGRPYVRRDNDYRHNGKDHHGNDHHDGHYHGHRYHHHHRGYDYYYGGFWYAYPWWDYDSYRYYDSYDHVQWCLNRYRSYDPRTDTYMGYDGRRHYCRSPYDY